ncbi:MAG: sugar phosphate isomerase/epimerase family protein [bacterium]|jgi:D-psicose/D-tagatose/L-ribulose 3-epimerase
MPYPFRHATCNEMYQGLSFAETCRSIRSAGYTGIEIAPFTLGEDPTAIPPARRREIADTIHSEGLEFAGMHWLMAVPKGLHVTAPDAALRKRSWEHVRRLADLCADLGPNSVMVFGSPNQRSTTGGIGREEAMKYYAEGLATVAPHAAERGVAILVEPLTPRETDVINTLEEAVAIVRQVSSPGALTMFDTHNTISETEPHATLVERYFDLIRHVHVNEMDGRHPGTGTYDYRAVLEVLARRRYKGWISLEVFDYSAGADTIARESLSYLESEIAKLPGSFEASQGRN